MSDDKKPAAAWLIEQRQPPETDSGLPSRWFTTDQAAADAIQREHAATFNVTPLPAWPWYSRPTGTRGRKRKTKATEPT